MAYPQRTRGWHRGIGDITHADNGNVLELLVPGEQTGCDTFSRQVHLAQAADRDTDWGLAVQTDPMFVYHAACTPATNYATMQHNGTVFAINAASGNICLQVDGLQVVTAAGVSSAVNEVTITNAVACSAPEIAATGGDTNISLQFDTAGTGQIILQLGGTDTLNIHDVACVSFVAAAATIGHPLFLQTEDGGIASSGANGAAGALANFLTGDGGAGGDTNNRAGGAGGAFTLITGAGGAGSACTTGAAGVGGQLNLTGGAGGAAASSCSGNAGTGGALCLTGGVGGAITGGTGCPGVGGAVNITGGVGSTSNVSCDVSGVGGALLFAAGGGGTVTAGSGASNDAGVGGAVSVSSGVGGASTSANGGNGGDMELFVGQGGVGQGSTAGGAAGIMTLHLGTAVEGGALGRLQIRNNTTGVGLATAAVCSTTWSDINAGAGNVYVVTGWLATTAAPSCVGVMVIETA